MRPIKGMLATDLFSNETHPRIPIDKTKKPETCQLNSKKNFGYTPQSKPKELLSVTDLSNKAWKGRGRVI